VPLSIERREQRDSVPNPLPTATRTLFELGRRDTNPSYQKEKRRYKEKVQNAMLNPPHDQAMWQISPPLCSREKKNRPATTFISKVLYLSAAKDHQWQENDDPSCFVGIEVCTFLISMFSDSLRICRKRVVRKAPSTIVKSSCLVIRDFQHFAG
jgi:hypothetical protein